MKVELSRELDDSQVMVTGSLLLHVEGLSSTTAGRRKISVVVHLEDAGER